MYVIKMFHILFLLMFISWVKLDDEVMKAFSYTFGLKMFECGEKSNYTSDMASDIFHFWESSYNLTHDETGCLILCALVRLKLLNQQGDLIVSNAEGFFAAQGGDESMVKFLTDLYQRCRHQTMTIANGCKAALELAKCFRLAIEERNMIPDISSLLHD